MKVAYWWIGPESRIYHTRRNCPHLEGSNRYWPVRETGQPPPGRRLCKTCAKTATP